MLMLSQVIVAVNAYSQGSQPLQEAAVSLPPRICHPFM